ncbi:MAG: Inner-membrane proton/drug antiporter (MSF type) of tripartite multidrug efflux system [uncultured Caballeronia sp.]|nr:MAG: Inner-membrane proton/drug antiporter (MSF type) of tripartite multidrug efflux system [uncultured Caballeronia sp.]
MVRLGQNPHRSDSGGPEPYLFSCAHGTAGKRSFFKYELLKDRNFATGVFFIFVIGAVMYATRALLPCCKT